MLGEQNPYQSPRDIVRRPLDEDRPWSNEIRVQSVTHKFLYRGVLLLAPLEMHLEYFAHIFTPDVVKIDGDVAHCQALSEYFGASFVNQLQFELTSQGRKVPVRTEMRWGISGIGAFRIWVAEQVVYSDGRW